MKAEYDFSKARRGSARVLPPKRAIAKHSKIRITMMVDADVLAAFKSEAEAPGAVPYQTRMNQVLRAHLEATPTSVDVLLDDEGFIGRLAERVSAYQRQQQPMPKRRAAR
jgi:uncharacterized protein (DUF4415 family)